MGNFEIPYLVARKDKAGKLIGHYWQPDKRVQALGFRFESLGKDPARAVERASELNQQVAEARAAALDAAPAPARVSKGTYGALFVHFRGAPGKGIEPSTEWQKLSAKTRSDYNRIIDRLDAAFGTLPVTRMIRTDDGERVRMPTLSSEKLREVRDQMRDAPFMANYVLRVISRLFEFARGFPTRYGQIAVNPAEAVPKFGKEVGVESRQALWRAEQEDAFLQSARVQEDLEIELGYALLVYTGQRLGDVLAMEVSDYDGNRINVVQEKTGAKVWIKAHRRLKLVLDRHLARRRAQGRIGGTLLQQDDGGPFQPRWFSTRWDRIFAFAGMLVPLEGLQRRDLRRTAVTRLAEAGCTVLEIAAITGHSIKTVESILEVYFVRTAEIAENAIIKLEEYQDRKAGIK